MRDYNGDSISPDGKILAENSWRLPEFRTRTVLLEEAGQKLIRKYAATEEAKVFLRTIVSREEANAEYLKEYFDVLCGNIKDNYIEYEYLPFPSLHKKLELELREGSFEKANELLSFFIQKVRALNRTHTCPRKFILMVTPSVTERYEHEVDCLSRGVLDLTPKNIIVGTKKLIVVDNEWSFDFPVPVVFVIFRTVLEVVIQLQMEIRKCTKKENPVVGVIARGLRTYYLPKEWVNYIYDPHISLAQMLKWEMGLRRYISGSRDGTVGRLKMSHKTKFHFSAWGLRRNNRFVISVSHFLKKYSVIRKLVYFFERTILFLTK